MTLTEALSVRRELHELEACPGMILAFGAEFITTSSNQGVVSP